MFNRKPGSISESSLEDPDRPENWNTSFDQHEHANLAFPHTPMFDALELDELDKPGSNENDFSLTKIVRMSSKATQTDGEFLFQRKPVLQTVVEWSNLEVKITAKGETKKILDNISGQTSNLEILAILGPSGAGKSTLLNAIAGKIRNFNGTVKFYSNDKKIGFAYVPQSDQLSPYLTVEETLLFASKFKNPTGTNHKEEVEFVIDSFNLHTPQSYYTAKCSGGERKRLSIGVEMISKPKILLLDEPTTGLDSTTAFTVIEVLKKINRSTVIITTIHQPNSNLFQLFDLCYVLSDGKCIFNGSPTGVVERLEAQFSVLCPKFTNPADFILDIANDTESEHGSGLIRRMTKHEQEAWTRKAQTEGLVVGKNHSEVFWDAINAKEVRLRAINRSSLKRTHNFWREFYLNIVKLFMGNLRDPQQVLFRAINNALLPIILFIVMANRVGSETGCTFLPLNETHVKYENVFDRFGRQIEGTKDLGTAFINLMCTYFGAQLPATLNLSKMIYLLRKENLNGHYSSNAYFFAILTVNLLLAMLYSVINTTSYFYWTAEVAQLDKVLYFGLIVFLSCLLGDNFGLFVSISYPEKFITATVIGGGFGFVFFTFSGFFIPVAMMTETVQAISEYVFTRHLFEALVRTLYGGNKCRLDEHMIFSFDQTNEFITYYNAENRANLSELNLIPLKIKEALRSSVWNRSSITELVTSINNLNDDQIKELESFWNLKTSFVLNAFDLNDPNMTHNFVVILVTIALSTVVCYFFLAHKLKM